MTTCKWANCNATTTGKSKYCKEHKSLAREAWKAMIGTQQEQRQEWEDQMHKLFKEALAAGMDAGEAYNPTPMVVNQHANSLDDNSPVVKSWFVSEGVCGFAWVHISPGNCKTANFAKKYYNARKSYYGGVDISIRQFGQSYERKMAAANAMAKVLEAGLKDLDPKVTHCYGTGRLD